MTTMRSWLLNTFWPVIRLFWKPADPRFSWATAILTGAVYDPLEQWQYRYAPFPAVISVYAQCWVSDKADASVLGLLLLATAGSDTIQQESPIQAHEAGEATASRMPRPNDCVPLTDVVAAGDLISLKFRNPSAGTIACMGFIDLQPL